MSTTTMITEDGERSRVQGRIITLGMFIIDSFATIDVNGQEVMSSQPDELGGAGTYAILGARMFEPPDNLGMVVHYTPSSLSPSSDLYNRLINFGEDMWDFRDRRLEGEPEERGCTRGLNIYGPGDLRDFRYLTPPLLLTPRSVMTLANGETSKLVKPHPPTIIHAISSPARTELVCNEAEETWPEKRVSILWEPVPPSCAPEHLEAFMKATRRVDIVSPNHTEAFHLLSIDSANDLRAAVEEATVKLAAMMPKVAAVVRSGALGACYAAAGSTKPRWVEAYWSPADARQVVDPTGAGNAFMGGFAAGLYAGQSLARAMEYATVAAGFTVQQSGPPVYREGLWNGEEPVARLERFRRRRREPSG